MTIYNYAWNGWLNKCIVKRFLKNGNNNGHIDELGRHADAQLGRKNDEVIK